MKNFSRLVLPSVMIFGLQPKLAQMEESSEDSDLAIKRLIEWVRQNGGSVNVETRIDKKTGVRGLYSSQTFPKGQDSTLLAIPDKLIVSPYLIA